MKRQGQTDYLIGRTKSRRWGVVYFYEPNEPRDEGDTTGPGTGGIITPPTP